MNKQLISLYYIYLTLVILKVLGTCYFTTEQFPQWQFPSLMQSQRLAPGNCSFGKYQTLIRRLVKVLKLGSTLHSKVVFPIKNLFNQKNVYFKLFLIHKYLMNFFKDQWSSFSDLISFLADLLSSVLTGMSDSTDLRFKFERKFVQYSYRLEKNKITALSRVWKFWGYLVRIPP